MTQEVINTGNIPNDGEGDPLRAAFDKINNNFSNLFSLTSANAELIEGYSSTGSYIGTNTSGNIDNINIGNIYININDPNQTPFSQPPKLGKYQSAAAFAAAESTLTLMTGPYGYQEYINIGATPNDGNGDPLRTAFGKINNNFSNLFLTTTKTDSAYTDGTTQGQVIFEIPVTRFYQGQFQIRSYDTNNSDMQDITLTASITNNLDRVRFTGHSTLFEGNAICRYDMDVVAGNVRVLINPIVDQVLGHFIASTITYPNVLSPGIDISLDGYSSGYLLSTEDDYVLTTEST